MARTAVVAGTATAVSNRVSRRQAGRWNAEAAEAAPDGTGAATAPAPVQAPAPEPEYDPVAELQALAQLKDQGILTEEEFTAKKKQILGI